MSTPSPQLRPLIAGAVGNVVEWFDWTVYALFVVYFSSQFFPSGNETAALLSGLAVFAVGFVARPAGSILFGRISDRIGRRAALTASIMIMAAASIGIGLCPTAVAIGIWAPVLLVTLRIIQGLSLGGEAPAATAFLIETARPDRRARFVCAYPVTIVMGTLLGALTGFVLTSVLSDQAMTDGGWRIPFLIGGLMGIVGFLVRRSCVETFQPHAERDPRPIRTLIFRRKADAALIVVVAAATSAAFFGIVAGYPALAHQLSMNGHEVFTANIATMALLIATIPLMAWLSDRIGRRPVLIAGFVGTALCAIPSMLLLTNGAVILGQLLIAIPTAAVQAPMVTSLLERIPATLRGSAYGLVFAVAIAAFGGTAPMVGTWLLGQGNLWMFGGYLAALALIAALVVWKCRETAFGPLEDNASVHATPSADQRTPLTV